MVNIITLVIQFTAFVPSSREMANLTNKPTELIICRTQLRHISNVVAELETSFSHFTFQSHLFLNLVLDYTILNSLINNFQ